MGLATLVIAIDFTAFSVALPSMERDLHAQLSTVQWVINAYAVVFGVVIVTGGRLADMLGRRTVFFIGAGIFAVFSLAGGLAPDAITLIACRAVMGAGGFPGVYVVGSPAALRSDSSMIRATCSTAGRSSMVKW